MIHAASFLAALIAASYPRFSFTALTLNFCAGFKCRRWPMYEPCSWRWARRLGVIVT